MTTKELIDKLIEIDIMLNYSEEELKEAIALIEQFAEEWK